MEEPITFRCHDSTLSGILHRPDRPQRHLGIVIVVGGPQTRVGSHRQFVLMARAFAKAGYPVLRFDYRGMGDSDGKVRSFEQVDDDIRAAVDALSVACPQMAGVVLFGLCDAASAALMYCTKDRRLAGLMLANPWVHTAKGEARTYVRHYYGQRLLQASFWRKLLSGEVRPVKSTTDLLRSVLTGFGRNPAEAGGTDVVFLRSMLGGLASFAGPLLVLVSERDLTAREYTDLCRDAAQWQSASCRKNVRHVELAGVDHTFSTPGALMAATTACLDWLAAELPSGQGSG